MDIKSKFLLVLVINNAVNLNVACDSATNYGTYCEVECNACEGLKHPLCSTFNSTDLRSGLEREEILDLTNSDVQTILFEINRFRNDLAYGYVTNQEPAANLHIVDWSSDLQNILVAYLQYDGVCRRISADNSKFTEIKRFEANHDNKKFQFSELTKLIKASYDKIEWNPLIRAEFNEIGCVMTENNERFTLNCLTNQKDSENVTFDAKTAYKMGDYCTSCKRCSNVWKGLCDFYFPPIDSFRYPDEIDDDNHIVFYIMIGLFISLLVIIIGILILFCMCLQCIKSSDESGTYILQHRFSRRQKRDTIN